MPRAKEYDRAEVLHKAMLIFWKHGFDATSIQDLVAATGLNRFGLYQEFSGKEGLFAACLDLYRDEFVSFALAPLKDPPMGLASIRRYFQGLVDHEPGIDDPKGCLMTNTAIEKPHENETATAKVAAHFARIEDAFLACLKQARRDGTLPPERDVKELARYFLGISQGLAVFGAADMPKAYLQNFIDSAFAGLPA